MMEEQQGNNTQTSFRDKWEKNPALVFAETLDESSEIFRWILERNGFLSPGALRQFLSTKKRILDAGCGNGRITALLRTYSDPETTEIVAVDLVAADVAKKNLERYRNIAVFSKDLLSDLRELGSFDFIYCQEVLHHTSDPEGAFRNVASLLAPAGELAIYVYRKKAPMREYADDFVREKISGLPYEEAMKAAREISELGKALAHAKHTVTVPAVPILGIEAGTYDVQRFLYHFFLKCFWNDRLTLEENAVINYDWYHPQNCSRHTPEEVEGWFHRAGLTIVHTAVDMYGITVRGKRT